jgi:hypothetical protein
MADPSRGGSDHEGPTDTMSVGRFEATVSMPHSFNAPMQSRELGALRDSTESNHLSYSHAALRNFWCTGSVIRVAIRVGEQPAFGAYDRVGRCRPRSTDERGDGLRFRLRPRPHPRRPRRPPSCRSLSSFATSKRRRRRRRAMPPPINRRARRWSSLPPSSPSSSSSSSSPPSCRFLSSFATSKRRRRRRRAMPPPISKRARRWSSLPPSSPSSSSRSWPSRNRCASSKVRMRRRRSMRLPISSLTISFSSRPPPSEPRSLVAHDLYLPSDAGSSSEIYRCG